MAFERGIQSRTADALNAIRGTKFVVFHGTPMTEIGTPDLFGSARGQTAVIEMKNEDGELSLIQKHRLKQWARAGAIAFSARSKEEVFEILSIRMHERGIQWP